MVAVNYFNNQHVVEIKAGDTIIRKGEAGEHVYGIIEGRVQVVYNDLVIDTLEAGDIIGEDVMLGKEQYTITAIAISDCTLSKMDRREFLWLVHQTPTFATQVMSAMSERIENVAKLLD